MREMHWHPNADEWSYFIRGRARVTIFAAEGNARTFDYMAGDVGIVPANMGHYVQNLSEDEEVEFLEIFRSDKFQDFSLMQWLGETPGRMVGEHLFLTDRKAGEKFLEELKAHAGEKDEVREHQVFKQVVRRRSDGDKVLYSGERAARRVIKEQRREIEELRARLGN
jgi:oxalate decarboxylase/phosphoglucose isomerase-like protein (cupin superfamily)